MQKSHSLTIEEKKVAITHRVVGWSAAIIIGVNLIPFLVEGKRLEPLAPTEEATKFMWDKYMEELNKRSDEEINILFEEMMGEEDAEKL